MYRIFFEKRAIIICSSSDSILKDPNGVILYNIDDSCLDMAIKAIESSSEISTLYIPSNNIDESYKRFCSLFTEINAGGGVVQNEKGEYLLIYRNNLWDLPKGKQEYGEDITATALREVKEECGVQYLEIGSLLCKTDHTYRRDGEYILKHTYWYDMKDTRKEYLHPQIEESITSAQWIDKNNLKEYISNTYPSIKEVFQHVI